jgi:hypothetical protein
MLGEKDQWLLTAYIDGELSARQRRHVERLLHRSAPARKLFRQLQHDAKALRQLSRPPMPVDLSGRVLQVIATAGLRPRHQPRLASRRSVPAGRALAAAAAILLTLGIGSYSYFVSVLPGDPGRSLAHHSTQPKPDPRPDLSPRPTGPGNTEPPIEKGTEKPKVAPPLVPQQPVNPPQKDPALADGHHVSPDLGEPEIEMGAPRENAGPVLTDRGLEFFEIKTVAINAPIIRSIHELERAEARTRLSADLAKGNAFRLELPVVDANRTLERLETVCTALHHPLLIDATAKSRQADTNWKTNYVLYAELLTGDDLVKLLHALAATDKPGPDKKKPEVLLDRFVLTQINSGDRRALANLLGVPLTGMTPSRATGPLGTDLQKPIQDQTASQITSKLAGQGGKIDPSLLALSFWPVRPNHGSLEIKRFLETRKPPRPGAIQLMLVLRNVG